MSSIQRARNLPVVFGILVLAITVALKLGAGSSHAAVSPTMHAYVHEDNTIGITFDDGTPVGSQARTPPTIPPGTYTIRVVDDAVEHNIHLSGPGVDVATVVDATSSPTWTVTFQPGSTYRYQCDTHSDFMYGLFQTSGTAGSSSSSSSSTSSSSSSSSSNVSTSAPGSLVSLAGTLTANGSATLTRSGKAVTRLKAGRYSFAITDKDSKGGFTLQASAKAPRALTGVTFVGTRRVTVTLTTGTWTFFTPGGRAKHSFTVS